MNVHSSGSGLRRAATQRALRRWSGAFWARLPAWPFARLIERIDRGLCHGSLELHLPCGEVRILGGREPGFSAIVYLESWRALLRLSMAGSVGWYRAWAAGEWSSPDPVALFALFSANARALGDVARGQRLARFVGRIGRGRRGRLRSIADHLDLGHDFFALWLDETHSYSGARPAYASEPLAMAQRRKMDDLLDRLDLKDDDQFLEIECGFGALVDHVTGRAAVSHCGLTSSPHRQAEATARPRSHRIASRSAIITQDHHDMDGFYDAILSVEAIERIGQRDWPAYLASIARWLKPGGRAAIQFISIDDAIFPAYARGCDFIQRFIFPGGCLMSERRFRALAEAQGLIWTDQTRFGMDYAWTLRQWRARFEAAIEAGLLPRRFDARFVDLWRYYLMYCEGGFAGRSLDVSQVTLIKPAA